MAGRLDADRELRNGFSHPTSQGAWTYGMAALTIRTAHEEPVNAGRRRGAGQRRKHFAKLDTPDCRQQRVASSDPSLVAAHDSQQRCQEPAVPDPMHEVRTDHEPVSVEHHLLGGQPAATQVRAWVRP